MPKSSDTKNTGPSSGSVLSLMAELTKRLSPVLSTRTTDEVDAFKKKYLRTVSNAVARLFCGRKIVPDCRPMENQIPFKIHRDPDSHPRFNSEISFEIRSVKETVVAEDNLTLQERETIPEGERIFDVSVTAYIPGKVHVADFVLEQCAIVMTESNIFVSLAVLRNSAQLLKNDFELYLKLVLCSFIAQNYILSVRETPGEYGFSLSNPNDNNERYMSNEAYVRTEMFKSTWD